MAMSPTSPGRNGDPSPGKAVPDMVEMGSSESHRPAGNWDSNPTDLLEMAALCPGNWLSLRGPLPAFHHHLKGSDCSVDPAMHC